MAGVIPSDIANFRLANVRVGQVTSSTRLNWSKQEVSTFEAFVQESRITSSQKRSADLGALLSALQLDRFLSLNNTKREPLRPIIETKVRRKLGSVITSLNQGQYTDMVTLQSQDRTRLQAARTRAIAAGVEPPNRLPRPDPIYTPDNWKTKAARKSTSSSRPKSAAISTVEKARAEVVRLEKALTLVRPISLCLNSRNKKDWTSSSQMP
ncbi:hypothetical protein VSDG_09489 [Cytospora chrysosperma]|uniref:Uncharacterized protein n=1 Tax=Cytospora chrysosperma TaxID=252740 RepID=A0A423VCH7_CYTCH|nr:hypothetical protein VSDG_09489 [Valsa sordida]